MPTDILLELLIPRKRKIFKEIRENGEFSKEVTVTLKAEFPHLLLLCPCSLDHSRPAVSGTFQTFPYLGTFVPGGPSS